MEDNRSKLQPLTPDLQSLLRTGVALTSVSQCVEELVLNSIDAGATCIAVRVDMSCFKIQVFDNGHGIKKEDLETVAERYFTSKCHTVHDLDNLCYFGYRGEAVASLRETSAVLEIVSRTKLLPLSYCKIFQNGDPLPVVESTVPRPSIGTTITAHNLFYNFPVRQKHTNHNLEFEKIRQKLEAIALVHCSISLSLRNDCTGQVVLQTHKTNSLLNTFTSLFGAAKARCLCEVKTENDYFKILAYLGKEGSSRKDHQFVYVNKRVVLKTEVSKLVNNLLGKSLIVKTKISYAKALQEDSPTKHVDRFPIFVILLDCAFTEYDITFEPAKTFVQFKHWESLKDTMEKLIHSFLVKENLLLSKGDSLSPKVNSGDEEIFEETPEKVNTSDMTRDIHTNMIPAGMSSKLVKRKKDFYHEEHIEILGHSSPGKESQNEELDVGVWRVSTDQQCDLNLEEVNKAQPFAAPIQYSDETSTVEDSEERNSEVPCEVETIKSANVVDQSRTSQDDDGMNFKTPLKNQTGRAEPPSIHYRNVCDSQALGETEDISKDYDEEDPLNFHSPESPAQEVPQNNTKKNYICISTPHISPGGNSTLSTFKKSVHTARHSEKSASQKISLVEKLRQRKSKMKGPEKHGRHSHFRDDAIHVHRNGHTKVADAKITHNAHSRNSDLFCEKSESMKLQKNVNKRKSCDDDGFHSFDKPIRNESNRTLISNGKLLHGGVEQVQSNAAGHYLRQREAASTRCHCCDRENEHNASSERDKTSDNGEKLISITTDSRSIVNDGELDHNPMDDIHHIPNPRLEPKIFLTDIHEKASGQETLSRKRANINSTETTASKLSRLGQGSKDSDSKGSDISSSGFVSSHSKCLSMNSNLEEMVIPVSLQMGFHLKDGDKSTKEDCNQHFSDRTILPSYLIQTAQDYRKLRADKDSFSQNVSDKVESMKSVDDLEMFSMNTNNFNNKTVSTTNENYEKRSQNPSYNIRDPFIMEIPDISGDNNLKIFKNGGGNPAQEKVVIITEPEYSENESNRNMDMGCDLFCDETLDDIETSSRRIKGKDEVSHFEPPIFNSEDSQEFIPTDLTFDSDFSREIQEPSRKKLNLSLVTSLGFSFSVVNGGRSGENTPNTPNSDLTVPKFELRTCCSPTGSEGFSPNLDSLSSPNPDLLPTSGHPDLFKNDQKRNNLRNEPNHTQASENPESLDILTLSRVLKEEESERDQPSPSSSTDSAEEEDISKWFSLGSNCSSYEKNNIKDQNIEFVNVPNASLSEPLCSDNSGPKQQQVNEQMSSDEPSSEHSLKTGESTTEVLDDTNPDISSVNGLNSVDGKEGKHNNLLSSTSGHLTKNNEFSPWSYVAEDDLVNLVVESSEDLDPEPEKLWIKITDKKTGKDIFVNKRTGHTITDENMIPKEDKQKAVSETSRDKQCRRFVKKTSTCSPSITASIRTMIEDHFDVDDEMTSVKWKDKEALKNDQARSVADLFEEWENPVFLRPEMEVISAEAPKERTFGASKAQRSLNPCTFTKAMLKNVEVIGQMDNKFIICVMKAEDLSSGTELLVVFDQHAAHERVRLEQLTKDCYESDAGRQFKSCLLSPEEELKLTEEDVRVMEAFRGEFQRLGISFSRSQLSRDTVLIKEIPSCITTKEVKQREGIVILNILKNTITEHVQFLKSTKGAQDHMPLTIHRLLCGLACRGAIKFGDPLTTDDCKDLVQSLSRCDLPFQCAHGRPSIMPLISTDKLTSKCVSRRPNLWKIAKKLHHK
uniref:Uncharacterized protein LOC111130995 n=1 Tax=Crassostrea virginica TaxID=6565 RepID=A0A8B8E3X6_CRAVI|nr:uncharacterized protein LOC111130995 [Crassostrea virginica]XP_022334017.1 uncharacterized protein LOC111130995 [Crassostrea virginica]